MKKYEKTKYSCDLPFHHMAIRPDGQIFPCCYFRHEGVPEDLNINHPDPFNHPFLQQLRESMKKDEYVHGCRQCYADEEVSGKSMRTDIAQPWIDFGLPKAKDGRGEIVKLTNIDLSLSNVCNNKCRMCGPTLSTNWYSDAKKLGMYIPKGIISETHVIEQYDLEELLFIKLLGGEPLMEQEKLIRILDKCNLEQLTIFLVTNVTLAPSTKLKKQLDKLKRLQIQLSIDSYGEMNDFLRKGSNWNNVKNNIAYYRDEFSHAELSIHSVASIYNVNLLHELIEYAIEENIPQHYVLIDGPDWMRPRNLPDAVKKELIDYCKTYEKRYLNKEPNMSNASQIFKLMQHELSQSGNINEFIDNDLKLNTIRNESWRELNPWLWNRIHDKYTKQE